MAAATQFFGSSTNAVIPTRPPSPKIALIACVQTAERRLIGGRVYCDSLTVVAVIPLVTLQLKVFLPHAQLLPAGEPHAQALQHQQTLKDARKHRS